MPDATNLFDYNRYMFVRGNPMKFVDPTGHCATLDDGSRDMKNDAGCWNLADTIATGYWLGDPAWWSARFTSPDNFMNLLAGTPSFTEEYLNGQVHNYLERKGEAHYLHSQPELHPVSDQDQALEQFMKNSGLNKLKPAAAAVATLDCTTRDCVAIGIDTVGVIGGALKYGSVACGVGGPGAIATCAKIGGAVSNAATGAGAVWTGIQYARGNATTKDLEVAAATTFTGFAGDTGTSLRAGVVQWIWDTTISPFWNTLGK